MARNNLLLALLAATLLPPGAAAVHDGLTTTVDDVAPFPPPLTDAADVGGLLAGPVNDVHDAADAPLDPASDTGEDPPRDAEPREPADDGEVRYDEDDEEERQRLLGIRDDVTPMGPAEDVDDLVRKNVQQTADTSEGLLDTLAGLLGDAVGSVGATLGDLAGPKRDAHAARFGGTGGDGATAASSFTTDAAAAAAPAMGILFATTLITLPGSGIVPSWWRRALGIGGFAGYTRLKRATLLEQEVRSRIHEAVEAEPGVPTPKLAEAAGVSRATATYHLRVLEREGYVASRRVGRSRHYFPSGTVRQVDPEAQAVLQHPTADALADAVRTTPGVDQTTLCDKLDLSPSLAHWHLQRLVDVGLVTKQRDGRKVRYHPGDATA